MWRKYRVHGKQCLLFSAAQLLADSEAPRVCLVWTLCALYVYLRCTIFWCKGVGGCTILWCKGVGFAESLFGACLEKLVCLTAAMAGHRGRCVSSMYVVRASTVTALNCNVWRVHL